jgi:hypothetical protein
VLCAVLRDDSGLTSSGRRFIDGMGAQLGPWQNEPLPADMTELADATAADHYAGWRIRHLRPDLAMVAELTAAWLAGRPRPPVMQLSMAKPVPTPVPDGPWSNARADLIRLAIDNVSGRTPSAAWPAVPEATEADLAYVAGHIDEAVRRYNVELAANPDRPASWTGLGIALARTGERLASRALLQHPELVRALHRKLRTSARTSPRPANIAAWVGQVTH